MLSVKSNFKTKRRSDDMLIEDSNTVVKVQNSTFQSLHEISDVDKKEPQPQLNDPKIDSVR